MSDLNAEFDDLKAKVLAACWVHDNEAVVAALADVKAFYARNTAYAEEKERLTLERALARK